jgi:hypothetical protein
MAFTFSVWQDVRTGAFEVVRWNEGQPLVVQTNIRTHEKATKAKERFEAAEGRRKGEKPCL